LHLSIGEVTYNVMFYEIFCMLLTTSRVILIKKQPGDGEHEYDC
jgi:hypothetical protein